MFKVFSHSSYGSNQALYQSKSAIDESTPFYKILERLEQDKKLKEPEVIKLLEVPRSTYRSWKDGTCEPSRRRYWRKLSEVFGVDLSFLIFGKI